MGTKKLSEQQLTDIINDLYSVKSLTTVLKEHGHDAKSFFVALKQVPLLAQNYADAQEARAELQADEIIDIADNESDTQKARNQIDARKWYAAKMKPNKFGDRIDVTLNQTVDIRGAIDEARSRIRDVIDIAKTQLIETKQDSLIHAAGLKPADEETPTENQLGKLLE